MTSGTFRGMASTTPDGFEFSVKLPETISREKRLDISKGVMVDLEEFLEKIMPLKIARKLVLSLFSCHQASPYKNSKILNNFLLASNRL